MNITFEEFKKLDIRIGEILNAEKVEGADKLVRLEVDFGDFKRQIIAGIAQWFDSKDLIGKKLPFVVNLEPRTLKGLESQGMLLAVESNGKAVLLEPQSDV